VAAAVVGLSRGRPPKELVEEFKRQAEQLEAEGHSREEIHRRLGVSATTLRRWLGRAPRADHYAHKPEKLAIAAEMVKQGVPYLRITRATGLSDQTLERHFGPSQISNGVEMAQEARRRIARERYEAMVRLRMKEGLRNEQIAERLGMSQSRIYALLGPTPKRLGGRRAHDPHLRQRARYLHEEFEYSYKEIAEKMGLPRQTVWDWIFDRRRRHDGVESVA
jgi:DNA invertase Pin-like site-specific DNA recombinase